MLTDPMDILTLFPVRKTKAQKQAFRGAMRSYAEKLGYACREEQGSFGCQNLIIGDPEGAKFLVTAHYDTCARMLLPNWITPCNVMAYVLYQALLVGAMILVSILAGTLVGFFWEAAGIWFGVAFYWLMLGLLIFGPANPNNANDNTSGVVTLLEIAKTMPEKQRHKVCFVLFDLEEAGLIGSSAYRKAHRQATNRQIVLNLDCVGDGDYLRMFPSKALKMDRKRLTSLYKSCGYFGKKSLLVQEEGRYLYPSDQMLFPYGVGICALNKKKKWLYLSRIHTKKDTILEQTNINILRAALTTFICCDEVN